MGAIKRTGDLALTNGVELEVRPLSSHALDGLRLGTIAHRDSRGVRQSAHLRRSNSKRPSIGGALIVGVAHGGWCHCVGSLDTAIVSSATLIYSLGQGQMKH